MSTEKALPMKDAVEKLHNLKELLPKNEDPMLNLLPCFGQHLATYLGDALLPEGFVRKSLLAVNDLKIGINGVTGEKIDELLCHHPKIIYHFIWADVPSIAEVIFPKDFATEVKNIIKNMKDE